mmetsp:Transcript_24786/g.43663  ORF Transcript_24786/g.43663 Transcript_24786/m.43663 type:complete len:117 (+) Transcript_24786:257-607(+)
MGFIPTLKKTIADNLIFQPAEIELLFAWIQIFEKPKESLWDKTARDFIPSFGYSFVFWWPISFAIFFYCPLKYRVLASDSVCILWDIFLSFAGHNNLLQSFKNTFMGEHKEVQDKQ